MSIYADTSFFVSIYMFERHSSEAQQWLDNDADLWLTPLHVVEWTHAVEQHVFRKEISPESAARLHHTFKLHRENGSWREVALPDSAFIRCVELARRHCGRLGFRTLDSLHVASALELRAEAFWTFDVRQVALARAEGLNTRSLHGSTH